MKAFFDDRQTEHDPSFQLGEGPEDYPEVMERVLVITRALSAAGIEECFSRRFGMRWIAAVHQPAYLRFLEALWPAWYEESESEEAFYPSTFVRDPAQPRPANVVDQAGWFCYDVYAPIVSETYRSAIASANTALSGAHALLEGEPQVYALCRPPGHHAGRNYYGGFCYLNNAAIAANYLHHESGGRAAILDLDYHHGNGTQDIFYANGEIFTASVHADPRLEYPYIAGHASETGTGPGIGTNLNCPLPPGANRMAYFGALRQTLDAISLFNPQWLVVAFGADICAGDPEGSFDLDPTYMFTIGQQVGALGVPLLIVQEGGYALDVLGTAVVQFLRGVAD